MMKINDYINDFLFNYTPSIKANVVSKLLAAYCLVHIVALKPDLYELFGEHGMINQKVNNFFGYTYLPKLIWFSDNFTIYMSEIQCVYAFIALYVLSLIFILMDLQVFIASVICWFCNLTLVNSSYIVSHGGDSLTTFALFLNIFFSTYTIIKADALHKMVYSFAIRWLQIHLCYVYFFSGLGKILGKDWFNGNSILHILILKFPYTFIPWTNYYTTIFIILGWGTMMIELCYPLFMFQYTLRKYCLVGIICLHLGIIICMKLYFFGIVMILLNIIAWRNEYSTIVFNTFYKKYTS